MRHYVGKLRELRHCLCYRRFRRPHYSRDKVPQAPDGRIPMLGSTTLITVSILLSLCSSVLAAPIYQTGKLVSVTDTRSNRTVGNSQNGSVVTVTDVEYRISVEIGEVTYVGSYWPRTVWSYSPTEFIVNDPIEVRIDGKHMFVKRPNGKELKTTIIQRIRANPSAKQ